MSRVKKVTWRVNMPGMLQEIGGNPEMSVMRQPLQILAQKMQAVAACAIRLNDPELNILMLELALYDLSRDGVQINTDYQSSMIEQQKKRLRGAQ